MASRSPLSDPRDYRDRVSAVRQDDLFARPDGFDGLGEMLVGFAKSKPHVVMILHLEPPHPLTDK